MTHVATNTHIPGPSQQQPHNDIKRASIRTPQTQHGPLSDNTRGEPTGTKDIRLIGGKEKEGSNHPKLLEVPAPLPLPDCKPDEVQRVIEEPSEDPEDSPWKLLFQKLDPSTIDLDSKVPSPTSKKNVNQPNIFALKQGTHSSFSSVYDDKPIHLTELVPKTKEKTDKASSNSSDGRLLHFPTPGRIS